MREAREVMTLYKQPAWKRFLHVLQGLRGSVPSITLMILETEKHTNEYFPQIKRGDLRVTDGTFHLAFEVGVHVFLEKRDTVDNASIL